MQREKILTRFLVPIDGSSCSEKSLCFTGTLVAALGRRCQTVTLLNVMAGGYLSQHLYNIDTRAEKLIDSEKFESLRRMHAEKEIMPILEKAESRLQDVGVKAIVEKLIRDGDPADQIAKLAMERDYSTIVIGRRGIGEFKELLFGSVTDALLHRDLSASIYVVGSKQSHVEPCAPKRILVAVDGSDPSRAALEEAALLAHLMKEHLESFVILTTINIARYAEHVEMGLKPEAEAASILSDAEDVTVEYGVDPNKIEMITKCGRPVDAVCNEAKDRDIDLVFVGRNGRSRLQELVLGSVSRGILHRCEGPIVAVIGRKAEHLTDTD